MSRFKTGLIIGMLLLMNTCSLSFGKVLLVGSFSMDAGNGRLPHTDERMRTFYVLIIDNPGKDEVLEFDLERLEFHGNGSKSYRLRSQSVIETFMTGTIRSFDKNVNVKPREATIGAVWLEHSERLSPEGHLTYKGQKVTCISKENAFADYHGWVTALPWKLYRKDSVPSQTTIPHPLPATTDIDMSRCKRVPAEKVTVFSVQGTSIEVDGDDCFLAIVGFSFSKDLDNRPFKEMPLVCEFEDIQLDMGQKSIPNTNAQTIQYNKLSLRGLNEGKYITPMRRLKSYWFATLFKVADESIPEDMNLSLNGKKYPVSILPKNLMHYLIPRGCLIANPDTIRESLRPDAPGE